MVRVALWQLCLLLPLLTVLAEASIPTVQLSSGVKLPYVSLGLGSGQKGNVTQAVMDWISVGGSSFDGALIYQDQPQMVKGLHGANVSQKDVVIITKVPCSSYEGTKDEIERSLKELQTDRVDLLLVHAFPAPKVACKYVPGASAAETWRALEDAFKAGKAGAIGLSSFAKEDLEELSKSWKVKPHLNQCSLAVGNHDDITIGYCQEQEIPYMAYSPLCGGSNGSSCQHGNVLKIPEVKDMAKARNVSAAQVALKWIVQQGHPLACASWTVEYMKEDLDLWSWGNLTPAEMQTLSAVKPSITEQIIVA